MSVNIATMGMFKDCCGRGTGYGGGAPPYRQNDEHVAPVVFVRHVDMITINSPDDLSKKIFVKLMDED